MNNPIPLEYLTSFSQTTPGDDAAVCDWSSNERGQRNELHAL